jgi:hypothetical protein
MENFSCNIRLLPYLKISITDNLINVAANFIAKELYGFKELTTYIEEIIKTQSLFIKSEAKLSHQVSYSKDFESNSNFELIKNIENKQEISQKHIDYNNDYVKKTYNNNSNLSANLHNKNNQNINDHDSKNKIDSESSPAVTLSEMILEYIMKENIDNESEKLNSEISKYNIISVEIIDLLREWKQESQENQVLIDYQIEKELKKKGIPLLYSDKFTDFSFFSKVPC